MKCILCLNDVRDFFPRHIIISNKRLRFVDNAWKLEIDDAFYELPEPFSLREIIFAEGCFDFKKIAVSVPTYT